MESWDMDEGEYGGLGRKKRKFTKEDALYGVFNDEESDEEDSKYSKKKDIFSSAPMGFVSAGTLEDARNKNPTTVEEEEEETPRSRGGLGSTNIKGYTKVKQQQEPEFEKFSKGIGSKLLKSMGWTGGGLGKEGHGIKSAIEVKVRQKGMGLGFAGDELTQQQKESFAEVLKPIKEEGQRQPAWRKNSAPKKVYKLPTEVQKQPQKLVITDMRGETPKVLTDLTNISDTTPTEAGALFLPELQHNIRLLADMKEADIVNLDRKKVIERDNIKKLTYESETLEKFSEKEKERIDKLSEIIEIIDKANQKIKAKELSLSSVAKMFLLFQKKYKEEYHMYKLNQMASAMVLPMLKGELETWDPLSNSTFALQEFSTWKSLMPPPPVDYDIDVKEESKEPDVFTELVVDLILPKVRNAIVNHWNIRNPESLLQFLEPWAPVLPEIILDNILENLVLPKINNEVENWNPRTDTTPIHKWLHPWLPLMGNRLEPLYPTIRNRLVSVLKDWHASDISAKIILSPWKTVFDPASWDALMAKSIIPKLSDAMKSFVINPRQQILDQFKWLMNWEGLLSVKHMVHLLETEFFPKWQQVLYTWLSNNPNFEEISRWYIGWKSEFPESLVAVDRIRAQFTHALTVIDNALSTGPGYRPTPFMPPPPSTDDEENASKPPPPSQKPPPPPSTDDFNFKDLIEHYAQQHNYLLIKTSRQHEGKPIYQFGKIPIILDGLKQIVLKQIKGEWVPISIEDLLKQ